MGWIKSFGRRSSEEPSTPFLETLSHARSTVDVTSSSQHAVVDVTLSIHATPTDDHRFGAALCMLSNSDRPESTGSVVTIGRRPHHITRQQFDELLGEAAETGHLLDGFLEIEATVDLDLRTIAWQPENGGGVELPHLDTVVENAIASLVETNIFGEWFAPTKIARRSMIDVR
jgi:hypothetical protein